MSNLVSLHYFVPELFLTAFILVLIITDLFLKKENKIISAYMTIGALIILIILSVMQYKYSPLILFKGMIVLDPFAVYFKIIASLSTLVTVLISLPSYREKSEYYIFLLVVTLGMFLMVSVNDLLMILIAMEMVGLISYILSGYNKKDLKSTEASLKYLLYGAASTGVMAFGFSYLYGMTGHTNLLEIQKAFATGTPQALPLFIAFVFVLAGLGYKIAMVPFHFWVPDVYEGAPTPITAFFSVGPKAAGLALFIRFLFTVVSHPVELDMASFTPILANQIPMLLAILAVVTMTLGNLLALRQSNIKRMLAYSAIAHVGYMVMALVVFNGESAIAIMFYMLVYLLMNFGAFWIVEFYSSKVGGEDISSFSGFGYRAPLPAVAMVIFMFSLTGIPPFAGFIGKVYLFAAIIKQNWYILAVIGVLNSAISLYYYANVVKVMFLNKIDDPEPIESNLMANIFTWALMLPVLILGLYWNPVIEWVKHSYILIPGH